MAVKKKVSGSSLGTKIIILGASFGAIVFLFGLGFLLIPGYQVADGFKNLAEVERYAQAFDESKIEMENSNPVKPDYTKFYENQQLGMVAKKLQKLGLKKTLPWSSLTYKNILEALIEKGKEKKQAGNFVYKVSAAANSKIVVWGDIQGAFHSLARGLRELVKQGVLNEEFKLANSDDYLVFTGDVVSRSPFIMETISLVGRLILINPEQVFYLRGNHESNNYWQEHGLKRELRIRASQFPIDEPDKAPLVKLSNEFFDTLPTMLYLAMPDAPNKNFVRFSHEGSDGEHKVAEISDAKFFEFLAGKASGKISSLNFKEAKEASGEEVQIKAVLKAEVKRKTYQAMDGLRLTSPENGITAWTMLSCPTEVYRKGLEYFYDAFAIINAGAKAEDWKISLYHQDIRKLEGFKKAREMVLVTGQQLSGDAAPQDKAEESKEKPETEKKKSAAEEKKPEEKKEVEKTAEKTEPKAPESAKTEAKVEKTPDKEKPEEKPAAAEPKPEAKTPSPKPEAKETPSKKTDNAEKKEFSSAATDLKETKSEEKPVDTSPKASSDDAKPSKTSEKPAKDVEPEKVAAAKPAAKEAKAEVKAEEKKPSPEPTKVAEPETKTTASKEIGFKKTEKKN